MRCPFTFGARRVGAIRRVILVAGNGDLGCPPPGAAPGYGASITPVASTPTTTCAILIYVYV